MSRTPHPIDRAAIEAILPHRAPFLFVDRVLDYEPGRWIVGVKLVSLGDCCLCPDARNPPVLPAAVLMEAMAQVGGLLVMGEPANRDKLAVMTRIEHASCHRAVRVGDEVVMKAVIERWSGPMGRVRGTARVQGRVVGHGTLQFALVPRELQPEALGRQGPG